jgi:hypothetical protein
MEQLAARWVVAFSMLLIGSFSLTSFLAHYVTRLCCLLLISSGKIFARPGFRPEPGATPEASATSTLDSAVPGGTTATATITVESANCRDKPRGNADRVTFLYKGQELEIVGKNDDPINPWWYVELPDASGNCWLWGMTATMTGNVDEIPIVR